MSYYLESLDFATIYDGPPDPLALPRELTKIDPAVFVDEGFIHPSHVFARFRANRGTLAVRVDPPKSGVRLTIPFVADDFSLTLARRFGGQDRADVDDLGMHRALLVSVQDRPRGAAVFTRLDPEASLRSVVKVDLTAEEVGPDGIIFIDFDQLDIPWPTPLGFEDPLVGLAMARLKIEERPAEPVKPRLTGDQHRFGIDQVPYELGLFAVNPPSDGGAVVISMRSVSARPEFGTRVVSRVQREFVRRLEVEVVTISGKRSHHVASRDGSGRWNVTLPPCDEPRLVRPSVASAWKVEVRKA